jgi:thiaminase/transcriptional activator TenA
MSLAAALWRANADLAQATLRHPFVRGLGDGSLPRVAFEGFIQQDAFFLDAFARAFALGLARSPDREGVYDFFELLGGVLEELKLHASYAAGWGISVTHVEPARATVEYTDFLLATAALKSIGETCAAMTPCMRLYAFLGQTLSDGADASGPYVEWVRTYAAPEFEALAARLESLLDRYADDAPGVRSAYRRALELELGFFEAAWRRE